MATMGNPRVDNKIRAAAQDDGANFRLAMREFATGVAIVAAGEGEARNGCTATAVTSLSIAPPSLIVCLNRRTTTLTTIRAAGAFSVNFLAAEHKELAERFAGMSGANGAARFEGGEWEPLVTGAPVLAGALAALDCRVDEILERYTHAIVIGAVVGVRLTTSPAALLHWRSQFESLG